MIRTMIILAALFVAALPSWASAPRACQLRGAMRTGEVHMTKSVRGKGESNKAKGRPRVAGGDPEMDPSVIERARRLSEDSGALVIDLPDSAEPLGDGRSLSVPNVYCHPAKGALDAVARSLFAMGARTGHPSTVAAAHVLTALVKALDQGDEEALEAPHKWARDYLRPNVIRMEDAVGRVVSGVSPGFDVLSAKVAKCIAAAREQARSLGTFADSIARAMVTSFPGVKSLAAPTLAEDHQKHIEHRSAVAARVREVLHRLGEKHARDPADDAAEDIAERLLRQELNLSGLSETEASRLLKFLDKRAHRRSMS